MLKGCDGCIVRWRFVIVSCVLLGGCDQVNDVADNVRSELSTETETAADTTPVADVAVHSDNPSDPPSVPSVDPARVLDEFQALEPHQIDDAALARISSHPEAAASVTDLFIKSTDITGGGLQSLTALPKLTTLKLQAGHLAAEDLVSLGSIPSLKNLDVAGSTADDEVVTALVTLPHLESLDISGTRVTADGVSRLASLQNLTDLNLRGTGADDSTVAAIAALPLRRLLLTQTAVTNETLPLLFNIPTLEELDVSFTSVTGKAFDGIANTAIKKLNVGETRFGIDGFVALRGMKSLEELFIFRAGLVENRRASVFRSLTNLRVLHAGGNPLTDAGIEVFFKGHRALEELRIGGNRRITDQGLRHLVGNKSLRLLDVSGTACTAQGIAALQKRLPECKILAPSDAL